MPDCIGVKFDNGPKLHYVEAPPTPPAVGTRCVVSTRRGLELALASHRVRQPAETIDDAEEDLGVAGRGELLQQFGVHRAILRRGRALLQRLRVE